MADQDARPPAAPRDLTGSTPGPWKLVEDSPSECTVRARGKVISGIVATIHLRWVHAEQRAEQADNARLIAAAPELLTENIALRAALSQARAERDEAIRAWLVVDRDGKSSMVYASQGDADRAAHNMDAYLAKPNGPYRVVPLVAAARRSGCTT